MLLLSRTKILILSLVICTLGFSDSALTLDQKLDLQNKRFYSLQKELATGIIKDKQFFVPTDVWNAKAQGSDQEQFTPADRVELNTRHQQLIEQNQKEAEQISITQYGIDLNNIRNQNKVKDFCAEMPKGGMLHVHPWGTVSRSTLQKILQKINPVIDLKFLQSLLTGKDAILLPHEVAALEQQMLLISPTGKVSYEELSKNILLKNKFEDLFFLSSGDHEFKRFMGVFSLIQEYFFIQNKNKNYNALNDLWNDFAKRAAENKISYVEVTQNFNADTPEKLQKSADKVKELLESMAKINFPGLESGLKIRVIIAIDRSQDPQKSIESISRIIEASPIAGVVGINLINNEESAPAQPFHRLYGQLLAQKPSRWSDSPKDMSENKLFATTHAGELGDINNIRDMIIMGADRIGHGTNLAENLPILEYVRNKKIPIEVNYISNYRLRSVKTGSTHPLVKYLRLGIPVSYSTDDEGIFESSMNRECERIISENKDITYLDMRNMSLNSIDTSFAEPQLKIELRNELIKKLEEFEKK